MSNNTYLVNLRRTDPKAGPDGTLRVEVRAPNDRAAKNVAQSTHQGYKSTGAGRVTGR